MNETAEHVPAHTRDLDAVEGTAWSMLEDAVTQRQAAFHQASLASCGADGWPEARTVVLRAAHRAARTVRFHTDLRSPKAAALAADPRCTVLFYDHANKIQLRLKGRAALNHDDAVAAELWRAMRTFSKACYAQPIGPSALIAEPDGAEGATEKVDANGFVNFVSVSVLIESMDWLFLRAHGHRRALICYGPDASRTWLAP